MNLPGGFQMTLLDASTTRLQTTATSPMIKRRSGLLRYQLPMLLAADLASATIPVLIVFGWPVGDPSTSLIWLDGGGVAGADARMFAIAVPIAWVLALLVHGGYASRVREPHRRQSRPDRLRRLTSAAATLATVVPMVCLITGRTLLIGGGAIVIPLVALLTGLSRSALTLGVRTVHSRADQARTLAVGRTSAITALLTEVRRGKTDDLTIVAACLMDTAGADELSQLSIPTVLGSTNIARTAARLLCRTVVVVPTPELDSVHIRRLAWELQDVGIDLVVAPPIAEVVTDRVTVTEIGGRLLLRVRAPRLDGAAMLLKGVIDRAMAAVGLVMAAPLMLLIAVAVRLSGPGPAVFRQRRVGRHGQEFTCLKFRTMTEDADRRRHEVAHLNERKEGLLFKIRNDPRITPIGSWLRRSSLDELPQLVNVLRGEMSLIGPRPPLPSEVAEYDDDQRRRLRVKPGLTGLWQVSGRSELPWPEAVRLDLAYVDNWSPALDVQIMIRTAAAVVRGTGAY